jgi:tetraacyldisaccharide 4'-kinase
VISVGNITVGGTGKTPCVILLAQMLQENGFKPAILSRGYGGKSIHPVNIVSNGNKILLDSKTAGDEPFLIAQALKGIPVITGAKRIVTGKTAINQFGANVLICDDAFQHRQIFRDVDIVLLDDEKPLGNGHLLPRGELRESPDGLHRAGCFILTHADETRPLNHYIAEIAHKLNIPIFRAVHQFKEMIKPNELVLPPGEIQGKTVCAFCGIAKPDSFKKLLLKAEAKILSFDSFPDHYGFSLYDLEKLKNKFISLRADYLVTTEKDAMRVHSHPEFLKMLCIIRMEMKIKPSTQSFENFIIKWLTAVDYRG